MNRQKLNQAGVVSLIVTMIMMIVISLIVLGFGQVARHNQREALDRQLSTQAYYAAETGINDVIKNYTTLAAANPTANCTGPNSVISLLQGLTPSVSNVLDSNSNTEYTCLTMTSNVSSVKDNVSLGDDKIDALNPTSPTNLTFSWNTSNGSSASAGGCSTNSGVTRFNPKDEWTSGCHYGVLRVDLYDTSNSRACLNTNNPPGAPALTQADVMACNTAAIFFVPTNGSGGPAAINFGAAATVVPAHCASGVCSATIKTSGIGTASNPPQFFVRLSAIYENLGTVTISATGGGITFTGSQLQIDATGKAQDELKRVEVRISLSGTGGLTNGPPAYAAQSVQALCKHFTILGSGSRASSGDDSDIDSELCQ